MSGQTNSEALSKFTVHLHRQWAVSIACIQMTSYLSNILTL